MATEHAKKHQFEYKNNSNLVLQADRSLIDYRPKDEPTGEVQSLASHISKFKMGDRYQRTKPEKLIKKIQEPDKDSYTFLKTEDVAGILYKPRTNETRSIYETLLSFIQSIIGDQPRDVLMGAADEVLITLKDQSIKEQERRTEISNLLGSFTDEKFSILVSLVKKITDFRTEHDLGDTDEAVGVTVQYDEPSDAEEDAAYVEAESSSESETEVVPVETIHGNIIASQNESNDIIRPWDVDAYWLQREINKYYSDAEFSHKRAKEALEVLKTAKDDRDVENRLMLLLGPDKFPLVKRLRCNRDTVLYCTLLASAQDVDERKEIEYQMSLRPETQHILKEISGDSHKSFETIVQKQKEGHDNFEKINEPLMLDLNSLAFREGSHLMANKKCHLPEGSFRKQRKGFEEVHVPAPKPQPLNENERLFPISELPDFAQIGFSGYQTLNRVQSQIVNTALFTDENLLICAPTGSGKTNAALLCLLREMGKWLTEDGKVRLDTWKAVYVAPMKSLVQEMVQNLGKRLEPYGVVVSELTGDHQLSRDQLESTQLIICTPEKWDIVTRKAGERLYTESVRLVILDEIHVLHEERGHVLEALVARMLRHSESSRQSLRFVALSATLPNYQDIALFLKVSPQNIFTFDHTFRPVPLEQQFIGITEKKPLKSLKIMNEIVYERLIENAGRSQTLVFVHSRKETAKTARAIRDMCLEHETLGLFVRQDSASAEILRSEADQSKNSDLKELLPFGFGIHHAGMNRVDRKLVEDLFADKHLQVLFSTATLAWGVNLPANTVIIKGTQIYSPEKGSWVELGSLDVLQMLGRAGRPQYDTKGRGILITSHTELQFYLSLSNQQLPIESQMIAKLQENLNAEVSLGTISNIEDGVKWLSYLYLFVRMLKNPSLYGSSMEELESDPFLIERRHSLIHSAAVGLDRSGLVSYDRRSSRLEPTDLGRIASHYYCTADTIATYSRLLRPNLSQIELFRVISLSSEFKLLSVRGEEKLELQQLLEKVPIPIKESFEEPAAKANVLLQAYISQLRLEGLVLTSDMVYITQSAGRLARAIFEICLIRGWAEMAERTLSLAKMIDRRMWGTMNPLRQFPKVPAEVVKKLEKKDVQWDRFYDLEPHEIGEVIHAPKMGKVLHKFIHHFPRLELVAHSQPISRSLLRVELTITPDFQWDISLHGTAQPFWILVTDADNETLLHHEYWILDHRFISNEHYVTFFIPLFDPHQPHFYVKIISDKWIRSETVLAVPLIDLVLPEKNLPPTELLDLRPLPLSALENESFKAIFPKIESFNPIQTQVFNAVYNTMDNIFIGAPPGSGKTILAQLAILSILKLDSRCVYVSPQQTACENIASLWKLFNNELNIPVCLLTGEAAVDLKLVNSSRIIISNPENWDMFSRRWKQRKVLKTIKMFIIDDIHLIGGINGPCIEVICSRMRYISSQFESPIRIIALGAPVAPARDISQWLGVSSERIYNFHPSTRPIPITLSIIGFSLNNPISRVLSMSRAIGQAVKAMSQQQTALVFTASRKVAKVTALDLAATFGECPSNDIIEALKHFNEPELQETLLCGVGYLHDGLSLHEQNILMTLFELAAFRVLVVVRDMLWSLNATANLVIILDTQFYDGRFHSFVDYPIADILKMSGRACRSIPDKSCSVQVLCPIAKKNQLLTFLRDLIPVESHLDRRLHDHFCAEVVSRAIENKQDAVDYLTWTYLYRRLSQNPNYYNLKQVSHRHLSDHLSELVESTLTDLASSRCVIIEDDINIYPLNAALIASYYYINYATVELFSASLNEKTKLRALIEIISSAQEFENVTVRQNEEVHLKELVNRVTFKPKDGLLTESHNKACILIQAHLSRLRLPFELQYDCDFIVIKCHKLAQACVDVLSSSGWLQPAIVAMEFAQMLTQAVWTRDSPLRQIPHFSQDLIKKCNEQNINNVFDLLDMEDQPRRTLLNLSEPQLAEVATFCNSYPAIEIKHSLTNDGYVSAGDEVEISIELERDEPPGSIFAPFFPEKRDEAVWVIVGDSTNNVLLAIKRITLQQSALVKLDFTAPEEPGLHNFTLYIISDSYLGSDQEFELPLHVNPPKESRKRKADSSDTEETKVKP